MSRSLRAESSTAVDAAVLHDHPLPDPHARANKDGRGSVLVIGGARETPGGILLAGMAALRSGAGRICLATVASRCAALAIAVPEARVIELDETDDGAIAPGAGVGLRELAAESDAVVVGTGSLDADRTGELVRVILDGRPHSGTLVVDAAALPGLRTDRDLVREHAGEVVLTPNPREMGYLLDRCDEDVLDRPEAAVDDAVAAYGCPVALRGADTWIAAPETPCFVDRAGSVVLATAGSGDVVAGSVAGLLARGAPPLTALLWGVHAHALAGSLAGGDGTGLGILARELVDALPAAFASLSRDGG